MASDESSMSTMMMTQDEEEDTDEGYDQNSSSHTHNNLSRLSMCTSSMYDDDDMNNMFMSRLSIESFDDGGVDADAEFSEEDNDHDRNNNNNKSFNTTTTNTLDFSSVEDDNDSDKEGGGCYSLPATPPRSRRKLRGVAQVKNEFCKMKEYASDNELPIGRRKNNMRRRRVVRERNWESGKLSGGESESGGGGSGGYGGGGGGGGYGSGLVVITRPKGGRRSLCMDLEEVKACKDLGFELEHERMLEIMSPSGGGGGRVSLSGSAVDTASSGGNSPIANWRISSPGDDPRDVKARLKVWAQAVAIASTSRHGH